MAFFVDSPADLAGRNSFEAGDALQTRVAPPCAVMFALLMSIAIMCPAPANAEPFSGTAVEALYCETQAQFCDIDERNPAGGTFNLTLAVPTLAAGDATFTLSAFGDFENATEETFRVSIEGFQLGFFLNNNPGDDLFDNASFGDVGNDFISTRVATAVIPRANLLSIIADGVFTATFDSATGINDIQSWVSETIPNQSFDEFISYRLSFEAVPEPAALALVGCAIVCGGCRRRRSFG